MKKENVVFSVFTKPWKNISVSELGKFISGLGFSGIEFPLRKGYQVEPDNAEKELPVLVKQLAEFGLTVTSVASSTQESVFAGCAAAGIPVIRIMADIDLKKGFPASIDCLKKEIDNFIPLCAKYGIKVGIQHHYGPMVSNSAELYLLVKDYDPRYIGAIWDAAHSSLAGEEPEQGLSTVWKHLCMVNFKNAFYIRANGPEAEDVKWKQYFTTGRQGLSSWPRAAAYLKEKEYNGVICLAAEYTAEDEVDRLIAEDLKYAMSLFY